MNILFSFRFLSTLGPTKKAVFFCTAFILASSFICFAQTDYWIQKNDIGYATSNVTEPLARKDAVGFSIGSKGYVGTGYKGSNMKDFWEYDPVIDIWTQKADFGGAARSEAVGFSIGGKGYIGTGNGGGYKIVFWVYNLNTNTWTQKVDFGGTDRY